MTDHREVMRQALNALIWEVGSEPAMYSAQTRAAIKALRAAIDEPVPEPVLWLVEGVVQHSDLPAEYTGCLYAHPPAPPAADADADAITVRLTRDIHATINATLVSKRDEYRYNSRVFDDLGRALDSIGAFPDAAEKGKP